MNLKKAFCYKDKDYNQLKLVDSLHFTTIKVDSLHLKMIKGSTNYHLINMAKIEPSAT